MKPEINKNKIVVFTGAGISAESGLQTFRDSDGLWNDHRIEDVATPEGWRNDPELVLNFYNERRTQAYKASPNVAHEAIARLEEKYEVVVITQNVDDLHERSGSTNVIHVHGQLKYARSTIDESLVYLLKDKSIHIGDACEKGGQLRPHIVWFGEEIENYELARSHIVTAGRVLVVGTSLSVFPAAGILNKARFNAEKVIVTLKLEKKPSGFKLLRGKATSLVPSVVNDWLSGKVVI
ncbi:MAG: NAD-dependent deacetylase [Flavobacteriales bacterium]|jgi:NAD-dependent deacetylase